jgi:mannan polymerase II complex MNN10 subunit
VRQELATEEYEWVLWMDFDTLFTNTSIRIEEFLEDAKSHVNRFETGQKWEDVDMIAAADCQTFNAGVLFFRNSEWTRNYLDRVWSMRRTPNKSEQDCLRDILESTDEFGAGNKHLLMVPQFKLNAYPSEITCQERQERPWKRGDWIIHFPVSPFSSISNSGCLGIPRRKRSLWGIAAALLSSRRKLKGPATELNVKEHSPL